MELAAIAAGIIKMIPIILQRRNLANINAKLVA